MPRLRLFGTLAIEEDETGRVLTGRAALRKRLALLALLARAPDYRLSRDKIAAYLWPETDTARARHQVANALYDLRKALGAEAIRSPGDELRLDRSVLPVDTAQFEAALEDDDPGRAVALYRGPFLDGFFLSDAPEFERWLDAEREQLRRAYTDALEGLAERRARMGDVTGAAEAWRRRAAEDRFDARVALRLMQALDAAGDRAGAIKYAHEHAARLREEFGAEPDPEVAAFAERLKAGPVRREPDGTVEAQDGDTHPAEPAVDDGGGGPVAAATADESTGALSSSKPRRLPRLRAGAIATVGAILVVASGAAAFVLFRDTPPDAGSLVPNRVVVAPFANRTGDPALEAVGGMAADWITHGLARTGLVEVMPMYSVLGYSDGAGGPDTGSDADRIRTYAHEARAGTVVSGAFYALGDSIRLQGRITDATSGQLLSVLDPIIAPADAPRAALPELEQRVMGALATRLHPDLQDFIGRIEESPPDYEVYRPFIHGMKRFARREWSSAVEHFDRAIAADSTFAAALIIQAFALGNAGQVARRDSVVRRVGRMRDRLTPTQHSQLGYLEAWFVRDRAAMVRHAKEYAARSPCFCARFLVGVHLTRLNRPREGLDWLLEIDPERGWAREYEEYWHMVTTAYHMLGEHDRELEAARRGRELHGASPYVLRLEVRAHAARGEVDEVMALLDESRSLPLDVSYTPGAIATRAAAFELRAHGLSNAAERAVEFALAWFGTRPPEERATREYRTQFAEALFLAGRTSEALEIFRELAEERPDDPLYLGYVGALRAHLGGPGAAEGMDAAIRELDSPYLFGRDAYHRARIAAQLGEKQQAVALLQRAFAEGESHDLRVHRHPLLDPLWDHPAFRDLLQPKG